MARGNIFAVRLSHFVRGCVVGVTLLSSMSFRLATTSQLIAGAFCCAASAVAAGESAEAKRTFNLPRGDAGTTLSQFASASRRQIFFMMDKVRGQQTNAVAGEFSPREALDRMLAGTALVALQDNQTGAFVIQRATETESAPPDSPAPQPKTAEAPSSPMKRKSTVAAVAAWLAVVLAPAHAADTAANRAASTADDRATILLSPFEVKEDTDNGYTAVSALSGGRTDTPLKLTPAAVSVMTKQFLDDIAATDFISASEWATNVTPLVDQDHFVGGNISINLRNMGQTFQSRNHFMWYVNSDAYNTERYEFARGPNGVLFGDGGAGGIATTLTKRARFDARRTSTSLWGTSYGGYRATIDHNQPVSKNFALRFNALYENMPGWREYNDRYRWGAHLAGTFRLTPKSQIRFEIEKGGYQRAVYSNYYTDQASYWDGRTAYDGTAALSTNGTGVARLATTPYFVYIPGTANGGLNDYQTFYQSTGSGVGLHPAAKQRTDLPNIARLPYKDYNVQPPDSMATMQLYTYSAFIDHRFSNNFYVELGYNRVRDLYGVDENLDRFADYRIDVNRVLPGGALNPNFGKAYTDVVRRTQEPLGHMIDEVRAMGNYRFDHGWLKQSFSGIAGSRIERYNNYRSGLRRVNGPIADINNAANQIRERRYWDQVGVDFGPPPVIPGVELAYVNIFHSRQRKTIDYFQILSISRLFKDRVVVSLGARRDNLFGTQETTDGMPTINGRPQLGALIVEPGETPRVVVGGKASTEYSPTSTNAGVVYYVLRDLGVFANYSETFATPGSGVNLIDGRAVGVSQSTGYDVGFKLELLNGRISGSASYYTSEQIGRAIAGPRAAEMNRIWTNLNRLDLATINYRDTEDVKGSGYEFDLNANPTRNLRLTFNLALPKASAVNLRPGQRAYLAEHLATWQAGANDAANPNRVQIQNDINTLVNSINGLTPGTLFDQTFKYTSNLYGTYTLPGRWKNLSIGGGANIRGRQKVGNVQVPVNEPYNYLYTPAYYLVSAHAAYRHKFGDKLAARFQLNISNLLDNDDLIYRNFGTYRPGNIASNPLVQVPNQVAIPDPRKFTFSATLEF